MHLYDSYIQSKIKINGLLCKPFTLMQWVHQGCVLSVLLYIISAKVLAIFIHANSRMKGVQVWDHGKKILNFADDTTMFLRDINYLTRIQSILKLNEKVYSSKMNLPEIQVLSPGANKTRTAKPERMV